jgi:hypothetical protein
MPLCKVCSGITIKSLGDPIMDGPVEHLANAKELVRSAETCALCCLFRHVIIASAKLVPNGMELLPLEQWLLPKPITLKPYSDPPYAEAKAQPHGTYLTSLRVIIPVTTPGPEFDVSKQEMDLFAEDGK